MRNNYTETAAIFKAFCDENRIRILEMLQTGEKCACKGRIVDAIYCIMAGRYVNMLYWPFHVEFWPAIL